MEFKTSNALLKAANNFLADHNKTARDGAHQRKAIADSTHFTLYQNLSVGFELCLAMLDAKNAKATAEFFGSRGVVHKADANPFFAPVKALFGKEEDPDAIPAVWVPNASAAKYAKVYRLAQQEGVTVAGFAHWLATYKGGLSAAVKDDTKRNGANDPEAEAELQSDVQVLLTRPALGTFALTREVFSADDKYVCVWGVVGTDEQFVAHGVLPEMSNRVEQHLRKEAPKIAKLIRNRRIVDEAKEAAAPKAVADAPATATESLEQLEAVEA